MERIRIKEKGVLASTMYAESYDKIILWKDGSWDCVTASVVSQKFIDNSISY